MSMWVRGLLSNVQAINYSVTREKAPVYTMGSPDARAYSRNKRGIAGSLIWINFDRHALLDLVQRCAGTFVADIDEIRPNYVNVADGGAVFQSSVVRSSGISASATIGAVDDEIVTWAGQNSQIASPWYSDQVLPFDITLSGANEMGAMCAAKLFGVEILNEGYGISIDDAVSEMQATFVARVVEPMSAVQSSFPHITRSLRPAGHKNPRAHAAGDSAFCRRRPRQRGSIRCAAVRLPPLDCSRRFSAGPTEGWRTIMSTSGTAQAWLRSAPAGPHFRSSDRGCDSEAGRGRRFSGPEKRCTRIRFYVLIGYRSCSLENLFGSSFPSFARRPPWRDGFRSDHQPRGYGLFWIAAGSAQACRSVPCLPRYRRPQVVVSLL